MYEGVTGSKIHRNLNRKMHRVSYDFDIPHLLNRA
jgi:hypothetical protein